MRYAALMRALNVGGHTVKMERLRGLFERLGFGDVRSVIASGNLLFDGPSGAAAVEKEIEHALRDELGYEVVTFLRTGRQLRALLAPPLFDGRGPDTGETLHVGFLKTSLDAAAKERLDALATENNLFSTRPKAVYWLTNGRFSDAGITSAKFERALGQPTTLRNLKTVAKLADLLAG